MEKEIITLKDCSIILNLLLPSIYKLIRTDTIFPVMKINNKYFVSRKLLDEWIFNKSICRDIKENIEPTEKIISQKNAQNISQNAIR